MKIKILKLDKDSQGYCYECERNFNSLIQGVTKWDEVTLEECQKLKGAIHDANRALNQKYYYFMVHQVEDNQELFDSAAEWLEYNRKEEEKRKARDAQAAAQRLLKNQERKRKQLEKLKKELEQ